MIRQIAPQFFTTDIPGTIAYYKSKLGFEGLGTWQDPPVYAIVARDEHAIHFRCAAPPTANPDKYGDELPFLLSDRDARPVWPITSAALRSEARACRSRAAPATSA